jgi:hypothetical protein
MASLTSKQLTAIEKSMAAIIDDPAKADEIKKTFSEFRKALGDGETVTGDDVDAALEVLLEKSSGDADGGEMPDDPFAPIFDGLFKQFAPIAKKAGLSEAKLQDMVRKAYDKSLGELDNVISATTEAVAIELGAGDRVNFGKAKGKRNEDPAEDPDGDGGDDTREDEDMEKILKRVGVPAALAKRIGGMQAELAVLTHDKAMSLFEKRASNCGEPGMAPDLLAIHEVDPELCARIEKTLKAKNEVLRKSAGWSSEIGHSRDVMAEGVDGPLGQLNGIDGPEGRRRERQEGLPTEGFQPGV